MKKPTNPRSRPRSGSGPKVIVMTCVDRETKELLQARADAANRSLSFVVREIIEGKIKIKPKLVRHKQRTQNQEPGAKP